MIIPIRLDSPLNGSHGHWSAKTKLRRTQREAVCYAWLEARLPRQLEPGQRVQITRIGKRQLDGDNLQAAAKSVRDACAAMLGINDRLDVWGYLQERGEYGVRVEIVSPGPTR